MPKNNMRQVEDLLESQSMTMDRHSKDENSSTCRIAFVKKYDIAVIGGGVAGVSAAIQAARSGKKTILIEKTVLLGGLATAGLINVFLPLCDGNGHQVTFGICEEMIRKSIEYGPGDIPETWRDEKNASERKRFVSVFSPASFVLSLDEMLQDAKVDVWLDTLVCDAEVTGNSVSGVIVENESGRGIIRANQFIDASGSAVLARRVGIPCSDDENYMSLWSLDFKDIALEMFFGAVYGDGKPTGQLGDDELEALGLSLDALSKTTHRGISGKMVSEHILFTRKYLRARFAHLYQTGKSERHTHYPAKLPIMPQYRKIYAIHGGHMMKDNEYGTFVNDSVGLVADWRKPGYVWEIPYASLYPANRMGGIMAAGRCVSATGDAWEVMRVIPAAAMTGQVVGLAASLSIDKAVEPYALSVKKLQSELVELGFPLHLKNVGI